MAGWPLLWAVTSAWAVSGAALFWYSPRILLSVTVVGLLCAGALLEGQAVTSAEAASLKVWLAGHERPRHPLGVVTIDGRLRRDAAPTEYGAQLLVDVERVEHRGRSADVAGGLRVAVGGTFADERIGEWIAGRRVRLPVRLRRAPRYLNPGTGDAERRLARRDISLLGTVKSALLVEVVDDGSHLQELAGAARAGVRRTIEDAVGRYSSRSAGIVTAVLIGDRAGLDDDTERRLQEGGTFHVIAISGGNIAILTGALLLVFRLGGVPPRGAACAAIGGLLCYWQVVGSEASVSRAVVAATLFLAARAADHRVAPLNTLVLSAAALVAATPLMLGDPGFHLTYGATIGILVGVPRVVASVRERCGSLGRVGNTVILPALGVFAATVCAELALLPVAATTFSRITVAGLVLNFVAIPMMTVTQLAGMLVVGLGLLSPHLSAPAGYVAHLATVGITESARLVDVAPYLSQRVPPPGLFAIGAYYGGWVVALSTTRRTARTVGTAVALVVGAVIAVAPGPLHSRLVACSPMRAPLRSLFLDVDQADATLVQFPNGRSMLVDSAGSVSGRSLLGERVVVPTLWRAGVRRLDYLVLTHGDPDHIGGADAVFRDLRPREVWEGVEVPPSAALRRLRATARQYGSTWRIVQTGDRLRVGGAEVIVWHPPPADWERQRVRNDDSVVLEIRYDAVSLVLPGDIGSQIEATLLERLPPAPLVVLKVPHHGSRTSSSKALVDRLRAGFAVVSAGRSNRFGHPDPLVVDRYRQAGTELLETGRHGAVSVCTDGQRVTVETAGS